MRIRKEAIASSPENIQLFVDSLNEEVKFSKYPGDIPFDGDVTEMLLSYLDLCFSVKNFPDLNNSLKVFNRITTVRKVFDSLASVEVQWIVNHTDVFKDNSMVENRINPNFTKTKNFAELMPVSLKFVSVGYTIAEYTGELRIGGHYRKESNDFGMSMKINMSLKYATADGFYSSVDDHSTDRFANLDFDSYSYNRNTLNKNKNRMRRMEYRKTTHVPFNSLYKVAEDIPLFRRMDDSINPEQLSYLVILANRGNVLGSLFGIDGDGRSTKPWFEKGGYSTVVEIDGLCVYDGRIGGDKIQPRLLSTIKDEADKIPEGDIFIQTEYDIKVSVFSPENKLWCYQLGKISIRRIKNDYCGTIISHKDLVQIFDAPGIELERLERDNNTIKDIQSDFMDLVDRKTTILYNPGSKEFDDYSLAFLKEIEDVVLPQDMKKGFVFKCYLDNNPKDVFSTGLLALNSWKEFLSEAEMYSYTSHSTDEFVFDLRVDVFLPSKNKELKIMEYLGEFSVELKSKARTNLYVKLKAKKLNTSLSTDYIPRQPVNRYSNLELD